MINISFVNMINGLLPFHKRQTKRLTFLKAFTDKMDAYMLFIKDFRQEALMLAYTNCQKFKLQKHLNDVFDKIQRRIIILDNAEIGNVIGYESESDFLLFGLESETTVYETFGFMAEQGLIDNEIIVIVPEGTNQNMVLNDINRYKLAGIKVTISN
jgi:hypothetical protein